MLISPLTPEVEDLVRRALAEDLCIGDATTDALIPPDLTGRAELVAKVTGTLAGLDVALAVFNEVDPNLRPNIYLRDSSALKSGDVIVAIEGRVASLLKAERTALNFLQRLSGIATETSRYVEAVAGYKARIVDTRKTSPGLRVLEKYAVRAGGGRNHRRNLGDGILIKDNHIQALTKAGLGLGDILRKAYDNGPHTLKVEIEVTDLEQVKQALEVGAEVLLLDNMGIDEMARAVGLVRGRAIIEASGGVNLSTVRAIAATGVDLISVGALTHSAKALDISMDLR